MAVSWLINGGDPSYLHPLGAHPPSGGNIPMMGCLQVMSGIRLGPKFTGAPSQGQVRQATWAVLIPLYFAQKKTGRMINFTFSSCTCRSQEKKHVWSFLKIGFRRDKSSTFWTKIKTCECRCAGDFSGALALASGRWWGHDNSAQLCVLLCETIVGVPQVAASRLLVQHIGNRTSIAENLWDGITIPQSKGGLMIEVWYDPRLLGFATTAK